MDEHDAEKLDYGIDPITEDEVLLAVDEIETGSEYLIGKNFSADKIFGIYSKFRQFCPTKCTLQEKNVLALILL